jgi:Ca2+-binding EF-hand superfamily protein
MIFLGRSVRQCIRLFQKSDPNPQSWTSHFDHFSSHIFQHEWHLTDDQVAEYKEVFMLFDKDEDGVLSYPELVVVMKSLGQRPSGKVQQPDNF